ncbi:hypothetical protein FJZ53_01120 [Candidatus Woesearchaeota archaeon]|nr:hypothetical protein [Candidatus Woesearchaeota archaeon]
MAKEALSKYEKDLKKYKRSSEMRKGIRDSYNSLREGRRIEGDPSTDFERMIVGSLHMSEQYAKRGHMDRAYLRLKDAYEILIPRISQIEETFGREVVNTYLSAIEKRAKRYRNMIKELGGPSLGLSKNITDILEDCKHLKGDKPGFLKKVLARLKRK